MTRKRHRKVFEFPWCIYCGGITPATEVDHVPARVLFDGRARPKGLEFPSCNACNQGVRRAELAAAVISRAYSDPDSKAHPDELHKLLSDVQRRIPGLLQEMQAPRAKSKFLAQELGMPEDTGFIRVSGPIAFAHLLAFSAKLAFAFHFHAKGHPVPIGGAVAVTIRSNVDALKGRIPQDVFDILGTPETLQQGKFSAADQFRFKAVAAEDANMTMGLASFRRSFVVITFAADDPAKLLLPNAKLDRIFKPGDLALKHTVPGFDRIGAQFKFE